MARLKSATTAVLCVICCFILSASALAPEPFSLHGALLLLGHPTPHQLELTTKAWQVHVQPTNPPTAGHSTFPSLSRDGKYVATAYMKSPYPNYREGIAVYSLQEKSWHLFGDLKMVWAVSFSPDGSKLAVIADGDSSSSAAMLVFDRKADTVDFRVDSFPDEGPLTWSPDSRFVAYTHGTPGPDPNLDTYDTEVRVLELATRKSRKLAQGAWPSWSPSGEWVAFINDDGDCAIIRPDGTQSRIVARLGRRPPWFRKRGFDLPPVWAPDSTKLLLNEGENDERGRLMIQLLDLTSGKLEPQTPKGVAALGWAREP